jgi:hypothetical protein
MPGVRQTNGGPFSTSLADVPSRAAGWLEIILHLNHNRMKTKYAAGLLVGLETGSASLQAQTTNYN